MKMSLIIIHALITAVIILFSSCNEENLISTNNNSIQFISFQSNGCVSYNRLLKVSDEPSLNWEYLNGNLTLELIFQTLCSATIKDSTLTTDAEIKVYLSDTNPVSERCICTHNEQILFRAMKEQEIRIVFYFKQYAATDYHLLIERIINLE